MWYVLSLSMLPVFRMLENRVHKAERTMERREFIKKTGPAVALAAVTGSAGFVFHNRETTKARAVLAKTASFEVPPDPSLPSLTSATNDAPEMALRWPVSNWWRSDRGLGPWNDEGDLFVPLCFSWLL